MNVEETGIPGLLLITPRLFRDARGYFFESFQAARYAERGIAGPFVQDNCSRSSAGIVRGLHYQVEHPQGKLVQVTRGRVFDVAVDLRQSSPTFGKWYGAELSDENCCQLYVPSGLAHGFAVLSETADFSYKCTDYYFPEHERTLLWNDPTVNISWPVSDSPQLSSKDAAGLNWADAPKYA